jgi:hypothetical protein
MRGVPHLNENSLPHWANCMSQLVNNNMSEPPTETTRLWNRPRTQDMRRKPWFRVSTKRRDMAYQKQVHPQIQQRVLHQTQKRKPVERAQNPHQRKRKKKYKNKNKNKRRGEETVAVYKFVKNLVVSWQNPQQPRFKQTATNPWSLITTPPIVTPQRSCAKGQDGTIDGREHACRCSPVSPDASASSGMLLQTYLTRYGAVFAQPRYSPRTTYVQQDVGKMLRRSLN